MLDTLAFCVLVRHTTREDAKRGAKRRKKGVRGQDEGVEIFDFFLFGRTWIHPAPSPGPKPQTTCVSGSSAVMVWRHRLFCNLPRDPTRQRPFRLPTTNLPFEPQTVIFLWYIRCTNCQVFFSTLSHRYPARRQPSRRNAIPSLSDQGPCRENFSRAGTNRHVVFVGWSP